MDVYRDCFWNAGGQLDCSKQTRDRTTRNIVNTGIRDATLQAVPGIPQRQQAFESVIYSNRTHPENFQSSLPSDMYEFTRPSLNNRSGLQAKSAQSFYENGQNVIEDRRKSTGIPGPMDRHQEYVNNPYYQLDRDPSNTAFDTTMGFYDSPLTGQAGVNYAAPQGAQSSTEYSTLYNQEQTGLLGNVTMNPYQPSLQQAMVDSPSTHLPNYYPSVRVRWRNRNFKGITPENPGDKLKSVIRELGKPDLIDKNRGGVAIWKESTLSKRNHGYLKRVEVMDEQIVNAQPYPHIGFVYTWVKLPIPEDYIYQITAMGPNVVYDTGKKWLRVRGNSYNANLATIALICMLVKGEISMEQNKFYNLHRKYLLSVKPRTRYYNRYAKYNFLNIIKKCVK
jgi:hypothetical protein